MTTNPPVDAASFASDVDEVAYHILKGRCALPARMRRELRFSLIHEGFVFSAVTVGAKHHKVTIVNFPTGWNVDNHGVVDHGRRMYLIDPKGNRRAVIRVCHDKTMFSTDIKAILHHSYRIFSCTEKGRFLNAGESRVGAKKGVFLTTRGKPSTPIGVIDGPDNLPTLQHRAQCLLDHRYPQWRDPSAYWNDI